MTALARLNLAPFALDGDSEGDSMEGRLPGACGLWSPTGGWKPPLLQPTASSVNSELHLHLISECKGA